MILAAVDPDRAREDAREILGGRQFRSDPAPRPFRGPLRWVGDRLETIFGPIFRALAHVPWFVWLVFAIALLAWIVASIASGYRRRRLGRTAADSDSSLDEQREDPDALEREADEAERAGDYKRAIRLRFRAGLVRLGRTGAIEYLPSITNGEVRRALNSSVFDDLATDFDEIVYGRRDALAPDAADARARWPELQRPQHQRSARR